MLEITRKKGSVKDLAFLIRLDLIGKTHENVTDVACVVKVKASDPDEKIIRIVKFSTDPNVPGTSIDQNNKVLVPWRNDEGFELNKPYIMGIFCKFVGEDKFNEDVKQLFTITITQDLLHDE